METPIATNSLLMGSLPARHARYRPHHAAVVVQASSPLKHELRAPFWEGRPGRI
jgi:hypothetical protein